MGFKLFDFHCNQCNSDFEELVNNTECLVKCIKCGSFNTERILSATNVNTLNLLPKEEYNRKMKKRSFEHTKKEMKHGGEKYGVKGTKL